MKKIITIVTASIFCVSAFAKGATRIEGVSFISAKCDVKTATGAAQYELKAEDSEATSITDTIMGRGIEDHYSMPMLWVYPSPNNSEVQTRGGKASICFLYKNGSPSAQYNNGACFVFTEIPRIGEVVYDSQFWVITGVGGYPNPMKTYYQYRGEGSCELKLVKRK